VIAKRLRASPQRECGRSRSCALHPPEIQAPDQFVLRSIPEGNRRIRTLCWRADWSRRMDRFQTSVERASRPSNLTPSALGMAKGANHRRGFRQEKLTYRLTYRQQRFPSVGCLDLPNRHPGGGSLCNRDSFSLQILTCDLRHVPQQAACPS